MGERDGERHEIGEVQASGRPASADEEGRHAGVLGGEQAGEAADGGDGDAERADGPWRAGADGEGEV